MLHMTLASSHIKKGVQHQAAVDALPWHLLAFVIGLGHCDFGPRCL